ncbi:hypothetical protein MUK42_37799 [Musa troglodytarum]|uniref:Uncharacterized protein n=1 Tax=Musa troglodytarum TaxID=320322 RepID=A0A9E7GHJ7_9LILI|nr:hypothetical protein MUK42_37799 [Musa troglodytarum]
MPRCCSRPGSVHTVGEEHLSIQNTNTHVMCCEDETGSGTRNGGENMGLASSTVHKVEGRLENQIMYEGNESLTSGGGQRTEKDKGLLREDGQVKGTCDVNFVFGPWEQRNGREGFDDHWNERSFDV